MPWIFSIDGHLMTGHFEDLYDGHFDDWTVSLDHGCAKVAHCVHAR